MEASRQYIVANVLIVLTLLAVVVVVLFLRDHVSCPYQAAGLPCASCGLSRTMALLLGQPIDLQPRLEHVYLGCFFFGQLIARVALIACSWLGVRINRATIITDCMLSGCWAIVVLLPFIGR